ncbi:MAG: hypothetical protein B6D77_08505 [gamma proteobacterium symbiont of Ctena orbiculata]|nr:MAG: hypothetical protein B6D77_08505 [gamma proteobacterium symbiont of Ctena orbiculata]
MNINSLSITTRIYLIELIVVVGFLFIARSFSLGIAMISMMFSPIIVLVLLFTSLNYAAKYKWKTIN